MTVEGLGDVGIVAIESVAGRMLTLETKSAKRKKEKSFGEPGAVYITT